MNWCSAKSFSLLMTLLKTIFHRVGPKNHFPTYTLNKKQSAKTFSSSQKVKYSQTRIKETHWAVRKEFLLSIVSFISCPFNVETLTCIKSEE